MIQSITFRRRPSWGDYEPQPGNCVDCGPDHWLWPGEDRCAEDCETCEIARNDGHLTECVMERYRHAADMRRKDRL